MADLGSRRLESVPAPGDEIDRDAQAESLLVEGLDRYFSHDYHEAIHIWTRVLFLDRSHARARAYIARARTALAERERRGDEMLAHTSELLDSGETDRARTVFSEAIAASGEDERTSALRAKLERFEQLDRFRSAQLPSAPADGNHGRGSRWRPLWLALLGAAGAMAVIAAVAFTSSTWIEFSAPPEPLPVRVAGQAAPVLTGTDVALLRARTLFAGGRLAEALRALDRVSLDSPNRGEADALRVQVQDMLLAGGSERFRTKGDRR